MDTKESAFMLNYAKLIAGVLIVLTPALVACMQPTAVPDMPLSNNIAVIVLNEGQAARQAYLDVEYDIGEALSDRGYQVVSQRDIVAYARQNGASRGDAARERLIQAAGFHPALNSGQVIFVAVDMKAVGDPGSIAIRAERIVVSNAATIAQGQAVRAVSLSEDAQKNRANWRAAISQASESVVGEILRGGL